MKTLIIRKYNAINGWPVWVSLTGTKDISSIDDVVNKALDETKSLVTNNPNDIKRLCEKIRFKVEENIANTGCCVLIYVDKMFVMSSFGDLASSTMQFKEMMFLLNMAPHI